MSMFLPLTHGPLSVSNAPRTSLRKYAIPSAWVMLPFAWFSLMNSLNARNAALIAVALYPVRSAQ